MIEPTFLLQRGDVMATEKLACCFSDFPHIYCSFDEVLNLCPKESFTRLIPVGSVEFTLKYANHVGISLPTNLSYMHPALQYVDREVRVGKYKEALPNEFVKPYEKIKSFTGGIKQDLEREGVIIDDKEEVWISNPVIFESEYRFYIQDTVTNCSILGWNRYDLLENVVNPSPDILMVGEIAKEIHNQIGPNAYSIDIGWRPDLGKYSLVEINDAWALGFYNHLSEKYSNPPSNQQYANMLYYRWLQIVFCNLKN